ncbi:MAG: NUDIX hydrolase [Cyanobacteria bacterium P01_F01_bin.150]
MDSKSFQPSQPTDDASGSASISSPLTTTQWLAWAREIKAIAQNGLTYAESPFDVQRYGRLQELAAEMLASQTNLNDEQILAIFRHETGYATPKVDARGVVFKDNKILLVQELDGAWALPGGWIDINESPREAVVREIWEESGYKVQPVKLLSVFDRSKHPHQPKRPYHLYKLFIRCELTGGSSTTSIETTAVDFFAEDSLPPISISRVTPCQIRRAFEHYRNPDWPTDFD